ncbi:TIGR03905 family TSCPD domain-containing protein [Dendrosporobacter sp. 1207_IL3150]|uniref:TIGR03905 family TSCPD domain-containing protein n=1 Tax=Dendrosporobacter sp. 1207_IL3150 TaxID=3084054 RepID=UPI002FD92DFC
MNHYSPENVCSKGISFEVENGIVKSVKFERGCPGSLEAICKLVEGMPVEEVIKRLKGISCSGKPTSCPDQLARALEELKR